MVVVSIGIWLFAAVIVLLMLLRFLRSRQLSGAVNLGFLSFIFLSRPVMFALGLDSPSPPGQFANYQDLFIISFILFVVWVCCFGASYVVLRPFGMLARHLYPKPPKDLPPNWLMLFSVASTTLAVLGTGLLVLQFGSVARFMYAVKIEKELAGIYVIQQMSVVSAIFCLIGLLNLLQTKRQSLQEKSRHSKTPRIFWSAATYLLLIWINLTTNYLWGDRTNIGFFLVAAGFSFHLFIRRFRLWEIATAMIVVGGGLWALAVFRTDATASVVGVRSFIHDLPFWSTVASTLHMSEFDAFMLAVRDLGSLFDLRNGQDFLNGLVSWIPRQVWPDKPSTYYIGGWFRRIYQPDKVNGWPVTVVGSWYVNFGLIGVVVGGIVSGVLSSAIDIRYKKYLRTNAFAAVVPSTLGLFFLGGGYDTGTPQDYVLLVIPLFVLAVAMKLVTRKPSSQTKKSRLCSATESESQLAPNFGYQSEHASEIETDRRGVQSY